MTSPITPDVRRLGRHFVGHDEANRGFPARELLPVAVERKPTFWVMPDGPFPLNQGAYPACTGYGMAHELAAGPVMFPNIDATYAMTLYRRNREEDRKMGNIFPSGGATVLATMKAAKIDGRITGYRWCFGVDDVADTLCTTGPVCLGIPWFSSMFDTKPDGRVDVSGDEVGGHFITLLAYDIHPLWGECVGWVNSWGFTYGISEPRLKLHAGVGWLILRDLAALLARDGEAVVPADYFVTRQAPYFSGGLKSTTFHDVHVGVKRVRDFGSYAEAEAAGLRPCKTCRPQP